MEAQAEAVVEKPRRRKLVFNYLSPEGSLLLLYVCFCTWRLLLRIREEPRLKEIPCWQPHPYF